MSKCLKGYFCLYGLNFNITQLLKWKAPSNLHKALHWRMKLNQQEHKGIINHIFSSSFHCQVLFIVKAGSAKMHQVVLFFFTATVLAALCKHQCSFIIIHQKAACVWCDVYCRLPTLNAVTLLKLQGKQVYLELGSLLMRIRGCSCAVQLKHMNMHLAFINQDDVK